MDENALPPAESSAQASAQLSDAEHANNAAEIGTEGVGAQEQASKPDGEKPGKTPEEREREKLRRTIDRRTERLARARAEADQLRAELDRVRQLTQPGIAKDNADTSSDAETLSLSRQELQRLIDQRAAEIAPTMRQQQAQIEHRREVVQSLAKEWGQEKFDAIAADLDDAIGGLADRAGQPKPAAEAIFEAEDPRSVIEYLSDPDHTEEADAIGRMGAVQAGRAIARLEAKLAAEKAKAKPQPSKAPAPIEPLRGSGTAQRDPSTMTDAQYREWRLSQKK